MGKICKQFRMDFTQKALLPPLLVESYKDRLAKRQKAIRHLFPMLGLMQ